MFWVASFWIPAQLSGLSVVVAQIESDVFARYGLLGLAVLALAGFARQAYNREASRGDRLEEELRALNGELQSQVVPVLTRAVLLLERRSNGGDG